MIMLVNDKQNIYTMKLIHVQPQGWLVIKAFIALFGGYYLDLHVMQRVGRYSLLFALYTISRVLYT